MDELASLSRRLDNVSIGTDSLARQVRTDFLRTLGQVEALTQEAACCSANGAYLKGERRCIIE
eukprot:9920410-Alexandrium_andersonii.AAC.1